MNIGGYVLAGAAAVVAFVVWRRWLHDQAEPVSGSDPVPLASDLALEYVPHAFTRYPRGPALNPDPDDVEGLARALASEAPATRYSSEERIAIAWTAMNWCNAIRRDLSKIMLPPHHQKGHWCSTIQESTDSDIATAYECLNGDHGDPTGGAVSFFEPALEKPGVAGATRTAQQLRDKWTDEGLRLSTSIGAWEFYAKARA